VGRIGCSPVWAAGPGWGFPGARGKSTSRAAPAELTVALMLAARRNVALEAERMKRGDWPCTLSYRLRGSTLGIYGLGAIGGLVAQGGRGLGMEILVWGQKASLQKAEAAGFPRPGRQAAVFRRARRVFVAPAPHRPPPTPPR